jgi:hypothetical protein
LERLENSSKRFKKRLDKIQKILYNKDIIKKEVDTMKKICFKHDYYWTGEFIGTPTDLISGRTKDFEKHEIICTCKKCGKQKSFKFKKEILDK